MAKSLALGMGGAFLGLADDVGLELGEIVRQPFEPGRQQGAGGLDGTGGTGHRVEPDRLGRLRVHPPDRHPRPLTVAGLLFLMTVPGIAHTRSAALKITAGSPTEVA